VRIFEQQWISEITNGSLDQCRLPSRRLLVA
jgi:hypothetical protein